MTPVLATGNPSGFDGIRHRICDLVFAYDGECLIFQCLSPLKKAGNVARNRVYFHVDTVANLVTAERRRGLGVTYNVYAETVVRTSLTVNETPSRQTDP